MQIEVISNSSVLTRKIGKVFSRILSGGDVILFTGELGGGKTTFISGIAEGLGITGNFSSPSFTILSEYRINRNKSLVHVDLYRLENIKEIEEIGIEDYIYDKGSIVCIEWGDKIKKYIKEDFLEVNLGYINSENDSETKRKIIFSGYGSYWEGRLGKFKDILEKNKE
jgi:tRNA threonylcarbamoyladenosine biosynthesis protein TsaE